MNTEKAALPISIVPEYILFNKWMNETSSKNRELNLKDYLEMAHNFLNQSNGKNVFSKTITMLKQCYKKWKLKQQIKMFSKKIEKTMTTLSQDFNNQRVPTPGTRKI